VIHISVYNKPMYRLTTFKKEGFFWKKIEEKSKIKFYDRNQTTKVCYLKPSFLIFYFTSSKWSSLCMHILPFWWRCFPFFAVKSQFHLNRFRLELLFPNHLIWFILCPFLSIKFILDFSYILMFFLTLFFGSPCIMFMYFWMCVYTHL